jgi:hypothetical protein
MRSVFDPTYNTPRGGAGRHYAMLASLEGGTGYAWDGAPPGGTGSPQSDCRNASEMFTTRYSADAFDPETVAPAKLASVMIHEYAHNVDRIAMLNIRSPSPGFLGEAWATVAQEVSARIGSNQPVNALHSRVPSGVPEPDYSAVGMWGTDSIASPWQRGGAYTAAGRLLLLVRELAGEVSTAHGKTPTLHQKLYAQPFNWEDRPASVTAVAAAVNLTADQLIDRYMLASVTAGLVAPSIADARQLPRFQSWDHSERVHTAGPLSPDFRSRLSRRTSVTHKLHAADGSHAAAYFFAEDERGVSLEVTAVGTVPMIVRLTRLK